MLTAYNNLYKIISGHYQYIKIYKHLKSNTEYNELVTKTNDFTTIIFKRT